MVQRIKPNMLTDEEAWDVAAFVNSQPRPAKVFKEDWPNISLKPFDHPFGPYTDSFSEQQHKYGPFGRNSKSKKERKVADVQKPTDIIELIVPKF